MQYINKNGKMPSVIESWVKKNPELDWSSLPFDEKQALREEMHKEQNGLCCYCCKKVSTSPKQVSIEHLQDKHQNPKLTFDYSNLLLSCNSTKHCNNAKKSKSIAMHPLHPECDKSIKMNELSGKLFGAKYERESEEAIEVLKLNCNESTYRRQEIVRILESYLTGLNICENIYELKMEQSFRDNLLEYIKDYPRYNEIKYIINKLT